MKKQRIKRILWITFLSFLFLISIAELVLRFKFDEQLKVRQYPLIYKPDSAVGFTYIPNKVATICGPSINKTFTISSDGFYGYPFEKKKSDRTRIAIVGASDDCGIWMNGQKNYAMQLQDTINALGLKAEILNFSIDGQHRDLYNIALVKKYVCKYKPDYILLSSYIPFINGTFMRDVYKGYVMIYNDKDLNSKEWCKAKIDYITGHTLLNGLYYSSFIVRAVCRKFMYTYSKSPEAFNLKVFVEKRIQAPDINFMPFSIAQTIDELKNLKDTLNDQGITLIFFDLRANNEQKELLVKYELPHFSLDIPKDASLRNSNDAHMNEKGHKEVAKQMLDTLRTRKYIQ